MKISGAVAPVPAPTDRVHVSGIGSCLGHLARCQPESAGRKPTESNEMDSALLSGVRPWGVAEE